MSLAQILDESPTAYLVVLGFTLKWIGSYMNRRYPRIALCQYATAVVVFSVLALRRIVVAPPTDGAEVIVALLRAGGFAMIAFGIGGAIGTIVMLANDLIQVMRVDIQERRKLWQVHRDRAAASRAVSPLKSQQERDAEYRDSMRRAAERRKVEEEEKKAVEQAKARRRTLKMQIELDTQAMLSGNREKGYREFISQYLEDDLPIEEYEKRIALIDGYIREEAARLKKPVGFQSLQEIEETFRARQQEIESMNHSDTEREALGAYLQMEKNNAIRNFLVKGNEL